MDRSELNWTVVDENGPKCYIDMTQQECSNNKYYTSNFSII